MNHRPSGGAQDGLFAARPQGRRRQADRDLMTAVQRLDRDGGKSKTDDGCQMTEGGQE
jgi:hypothetical protein